MRSWVLLAGRSQRLRPLLVLVLTGGGAVVGLCLLSCWRRVAPREFVFEQRKKSYHLSTSVGLLRLPVVLAGRRVLRVIQYSITTDLPRSFGSVSWVSNQVGSCWEMAQLW